MQPLPTLARLLLALLAQQTADAARATASKPPREDLLLITLDTTRADEIAPWGPGGVAPNLDRLATESLTCAVARAPVPLTLPSHTSMMTGLYPFAHGIRDNDLYRLDPGAQPVAELLKTAGYRTEAVVAATVLRHETGLDLGFEKYHDLQFKRGRNFALEAERPANEVTELALARLEVADPRPLFLWLHYFDAHYPYNAPDGPPPSAGRKAAYEAEIRFYDREIGRLLARLRESGRLARTWIVVCGDHGEGLKIQQELTHAYLCEEGTLRVPLFVRRPDGKLRGRLEMPATTADVGPTLLAAAGLETPYPVHGVDLVAAFAAERRGDDRAADRPIYFESHAGYHQFRWARLEGVAVRDWKFVRNVHDELFDLSSAEFEKKNRASERPEIARALRERWQSIVAASGTRFSSIPPAPDGAATARLHEIGYLARMMGDTSEGEEGLLDPREHYQAYVDFNLGVTLGQAGKVDESIKLLERIARDYPRNPGFHDWLGRMLAQAKRPDEATRELEASLALDSEQLVPNYLLGGLKREKSDFEGAFKLLTKALSIYPGHFDAHLQIRAVYDAARQYEDVLRESLVILSLADEIRDPDCDKVAQNTLDEWLPNLAKRLATVPERAGILARALERMPPNPGPLLKRGREFLERESAH